MKVIGTPLFVKDLEKLVCNKDLRRWYREIASIFINNFNEVKTRSVSLNNNKQYTFIYDEIVVNYRKQNDNILLMRLKLATTEDYIKIQGYPPEPENGPHPDAP